MQIVFCDLETSHLDPEKGGILEIGAIFCDGSGNKVLTFCMDADPGPVEMSPGALAVNGFTPERIAVAPAIEDVLATFNYHVDGRALLAGWNVPFDAGFLQVAYKRAGLKWPFDFHTLDVWSLYQTLKLCGIVEGRLSLKGLCEQYGLLQEGDGEAHSALTDITWTYRLWRHALSHYICQN